MQASGLTNIAWYASTRVRTYLRDTSVLRGVRNMPGHPTVSKSSANYKSIIILTLVKKAYKKTSVSACGNVVPE